MLFLLGLPAAACDNGFKYSNLFEAKMLDGTTIKYGIKDTLVYLQAEMPRYRPNSLPPGMEYDSLIGFKKVDESKKWSKSHLKADEAFGLPEGEYYYKVLLYHHSAPCRGNESICQFTPYDGKMALWPSSLIYSSEPEIGYRADSDNMHGYIDLSTYIIYVGYNEQGERIDLYYPCKPDDLCWYF